MINRFKKTSLGHALYVFSKRPVLGWPLRVLVSLTKVEAFQPAHFVPAHLAHNAAERRTLRAFEEGLTTRATATPDGDPKP